MILFPLPYTNFPEVIGPVTKQVQQPQSNSLPSIDDTSIDEPDIVSTETTSSIPPRRNPSRARNKHPKFKNYVSFTSKHSIDHSYTYKRLSPAHNAFLSSLDSTLEPQTFEEANQNSDWRQAMADELLALHENKTWFVVKLPYGKKAVGSRWIFKTKFHSDGKIERKKARLLARGFTQTYGVDYKETFASVAKMSTVRVLLSIVVNHAWNLHQMDVKNAFLHGELEEEVYMRLPPGHS